jgi:hypothetical protein
LTAFPLHAADGCRWTETQVQYEEDIAFAVRLVVAFAGSSGLRQRRFDLA